MYGCYRNRKFTDIFPSVNEFKTAYTQCGIPGKIKPENVDLLYYLLYARYGNSTIASADETQFQYKVFSLVFQFGPTWEKELEIQEKVRNMTEDELMTGTTKIYNAALNPDVAPTTAALEELPYISQQNVSKTKRGKVEQYAIVLDLLKRDVTNYFIDKFKVLFLTFVEPDYPQEYCCDDGCDVEV